MSIEHSAEIALTVTLNKAGLTALRRDLKSITDALNTQKAVKQLSSMEENMKRLRKELTQSKQEIKSLQAAQQKAADVIVAAERKTQAEIRKSRAERKKAEGAIRSSAAAEKQLASIMATQKGAVLAYTMAMRTRIGTERTLAILQKQRAGAEKATAVVTKTATGLINANADAIRKLRAEQRAGAAQSKASIAAEVQLNTLMRTKSNTVRAYISDMMKRIGAERTLAIVQRQAADAAKRQEAANKALSGSTGKVRIQIKSAVGDIQRYHMSLVRGSNAQRAFGQSLQTARTFVGQFSKALSDSEHKMDALFRASFRLSIVGFTLKRFADNIIRGFTGIMDVFEEFEYTLLRAAGAIEIWTGVTWDGADATDILQSRILEMTKTLKLFNPEEVAKALYFWGSATGQVVDSVDELDIAMNGLDTIMKTAAMTQSEFEMTIKGVYSILTQFYNGSLEETTQVTEKLFLATQKTAAEFPDLIQSFKMVGPVAAQAGASFDQVNEAFGKLSDLGLRGSMAGRGLRQFFIQLLRPSGPATAKWEELFQNNPFDKFDGKSMQEVIFPEGEFIGITETMQALAKATEHLNNAERVRDIARVTTANSLPMVIALMAQERNVALGLAEAYTKIQEADPTEYFIENWERLSGSWKATKQSFLNMVQILKIELGTNMAKIMEPIVQSLNEILERAQQFVKLNPQLIGWITRLGALAAIAATVAGTLFIAAGAIVGLAAAIGLVWDSTEKWRGAMGRLLGIFAILFVAIVQNFSYLQDRVAKVLENLTAAFGDLGNAGKDLVVTFGEIVRPVEEFFGYVVRGIADIAVIISDIIKWAASIELLGGALNFVMPLLQTFASAAILAGIFKMVAGMTLLKNVTVGMAVGHSWSVIVSALKFMISKQVLVGLSALIKKLYAVMIAMGPKGWAALGISLALTAHQLPVVGDMVRRLSTDWKVLNAQLRDSTSYFGDDEIALALKELAINMSPGTVKLPEAQLILEPWVDELNAWAKKYAPELELGPLTVESPKEDAYDFYAALGQKASAWSGDDAVGKRWYNLGQDMRKGQIAFETILAEVFADGVNYAEKWAESHGELVKAMFNSGREIRIGTEQYSDAIRDIAGNVRDSVDWLGRPVAGGISVAEIVNSIFSWAPDKLNYDELLEFTDRINLNFGNYLAENISVEQMLRILGSQVGKESTIANKAIIEYATKVLTLQNPYEIIEALSKELPGMRGLTLFDLFDHPDFTNVQPILEMVMSHYDAGIAALEGGAAELGLTEIENRLKNVLETMTTNLFMDAFPDLSDISHTIMELGLSRDPADLEALAQYFVEEFQGGFMEQITSGKFEGTSVTTLKAIASALADARYGGDALKNLMSEQAQEDGSTAGEEAATSLRDSFVEAFNAVPMNISEEIDAIKKAKELGSAVETVMRAVRQRRKAVRVGFGRDSNAQSRAGAIEVADRESAAVTARHDRLMNRAGNAGEQGKVGKAAEITGRARDTGKSYLEAVLPDYNSSPRAVQRNMRDFARQYAEDFPQVAERVLSSMNIKWPEGFIDSILPDSKDVKEGMLRVVEPMVPKMPRGWNAPKEPYKAPYGSDKTPYGTTIPEPTIKATTIAADNITVDTASFEGVGIEAAQSIVTGIKTDLAAVDYSTILTTVSTGLTAAESAGKSMWQNGKDRAADWRVGWVEQFALMSKAGASLPTAISSAITSSGNSSKESAYTNGQSVGEAWVSGMAAGLQGAVGTIDVAFHKAVESGEGKSPPKKGPLKNIDKWGENVGSAWTEGVVRGMRGGEEKILSANAFTSAEITHKGKNEMTIKLEVTSPDGSVNRQKQGEMRRGAMEALTVAGLEHAVTVG